MLYYSGFTRRLGGNHFSFFCFDPSLFSGSLCFSITSPTHCFQPVVSSSKTLSLPALYPDQLTLPKTSTRAPPSLTFSLLREPEASLSNLLR